MALTRQTCGDEVKATLSPEALDRIRDGLRDWIADHVKRRRSFADVEDIRVRFRSVYNQVLSDLGYFALPPEVFSADEDEIDEEEWAQMRPVTP